MSEQKAEIGIFGGSGFYSLFDNAEEIDLNTPYGKPADKITVGEITGRRVAFLPRHGKEHKFAPHTIPFLANLWAFKELGVTRVIAPTAAGSLQPNIKPGEFVVCDQFVDRTFGRPSTFYNGPKIVHISCADPYCPQMRQVAINSCKNLSISVHEKGAVVVIEGPRFSTKAESRWYQNSGFEVINMTQCPEVYLAKELNMCYVNISLITDYDAGLIGQGDIKPVDAKEVLEVFNKNIENVKKLVRRMIQNIPVERRCECALTLSRAEFN